MHDNPNNPPVKGCGHGGNPGDICSDCSFTPTLAPRWDGTGPLPEETEGQAKARVDDGVAWLEQARKRLFSDTE